MLPVSNVMLPHTLLSEIVRFGPTPLVSYLRTVYPLSTRYSTRCLWYITLLYDGVIIESAPAPGNIITPRYVVFH